jgi:hypothetical protein
VVEARRPSGELFGFDRVHNLSNQSAFYIADAAKDFGQEDDITVLTVRRWRRPWQRAMERKTGPFNWEEWKAYRDEGRK